MPDVTYFTDIPDGPNNPSQDQPLMKINTNATDQIIAVDHYSFNTSDSSGGYHRQCTFAGKNTPGAQTDPASTLFTGNGTASTNAELFYKNQDATFIVSGVKAFGNFTQVNTAAPVAVTLQNGYNVVSINKVGTTRYDVTLTTNAVKGANPVIFVTINSVVGAAAPLNTNTVSWSYAANVLSIFTNNVQIAPDARQVSFAILEA